MSLRISGSGGLITLGGVPREQKMLKGHPPRVIYHQVYSYTKITSSTGSSALAPRSQGASSAIKGDDKGVAPPLNTEVATPLDDPGARSAPAAREDARAIGDRDPAVGDVRAVGVLTTGDLTTGRV